MFEKRKEIADLQSQVEAFDREMANAAADMESLQSRRQSVLLQGTDDDLKAHDEAFGVAQRTKERTAAKKADAEQRLATARQEASDAEAAALKGEADASADDAAGAIKKAFSDIRKAVAKARDKLSAADQTIATANRRMPDGEQPVLTVEARVFAGSDLPEEIISEKPTLRWIYERSGAAVPTDKLPKIIVDRDDPFSGQIRWDGHNLQELGTDRVVCREFLRREFLPRLQGRHARDLEEALKQIEDLATVQELQDDRAPQVEWSRLPDETTSQAASTKAA
jgi:hypothetical protein